MENIKTLSNENYINKNRMNLKTLPSYKNLKITNGHKSHLNLFKLSKKSPKFLSIEEYDLQQNKSLDNIVQVSKKKNQKIKKEKKIKMKKIIKLIMNRLKNYFKIRHKV